MPPPLRSVRKDHKKVPDDLISFGPPSRPMGDGNNAPDTQLSWILATICQKAANSWNSKSECVSTEDMLSYIDRENGDPGKPSGQVIISLDAIALYPSLEAEETSNVCAEMIVNSGMWVEAIDWEEVGLYVSLTGGEEEFSKEIIPQRKFKAGAKPQITTYEVIGPLPRNKNTSKFLSPDRIPTQQEKNRLLSVLLKNAIKTLMVNHTYRWKGEVRLQARGGPIGDKLAQAAARLFMIWWDNTFIVLLESARLTVRLYKRYVDDGNLKLTALAPGAMWDCSTKSIVYSNSVDNREPDRRTAEVVKQIADSVTGMLVWTADFPSANSNGKLPILDIETWTEETVHGTRTCYSFYRKPMANPVAIPQRSAIPTSIKFSTYRQEVTRILRNTSFHLPWSHKAKLLTNFSWQLKVSGYPQNFRSKILSEGLAGFLKMVKTRAETGTEINRPGDVIRQQKKKTSKNDWFNKGESLYDSVLFVPATPHSALAKLLQNHEKQNNQGRSSRIKIVERAGISLKNVLAPNDPWGIVKCQDLDCFTCTTNMEPAKVSCRTPGIIYNIFCNICGNDNREAVYVGQSGKNAYSRGKDHIDAFLAGSNSHCLVIHHRTHHPDLPRLVAHYRMAPIRSYKTPLDRQISEALDINNSEVDILLNSGSEWGAGKLPRASVARPNES